jgi:hypothetical protein
MIQATGTLRKLDLTTNGTPLTTLEEGKMTFDLGEKTFTITRKGFFGPTTELWLDKTLVASAKQAVLVNTHAVTHAGHGWQLKAIDMMAKKFGLWRGEEQVGSILPGQLGSQVEAVVDLPDELPVEVHVFLMWIVLWKWINDAATTS